MRTTTTWRSVFTEAVEEATFCRHIKTLFLRKVMWRQYVAPGLSLRVECSNANSATTSMSALLLSCPFHCVSMNLFFDAVIVDRAFRLKDVPKEHERPNAHGDYWKGPVHVRKHKSPKGESSKANRDVSEHECLRRITAAITQVAANKFKIKTDAKCDLGSSHCYVAPPSIRGKVYQVGWDSWLVKCHQVSRPT